MTNYGVDVSHWNPVTDWAAVRRNGISFVSFKLTEGTNYTDTTSTARVPAARAAGLVAGGYHFAQPGNPRGQADHFISRLRTNGLLNNGSLAPMLDMEAAGLRSGADWFVREFIHRLREAAGVRRVFVYANLDWFQHALHPDQWADDGVLLWIARYNGDPGKPGWAHAKLALHQHTQNGTVPGIAGHVDRNATVGGYSLANFTINGAAPPATTPAPKPSAPAAGGTYVIRPGDTLSAIATRNHTTVATLASLNGIRDPNRIQAGATLRLPGGTSSRRYQIRAGDTLSAIATRNHTTVAALASLNKIPNPNRIQAGAWLELP